MQKLSGFAGVVAALVLFTGSVFANSYDDGVVAYTVQDYPKAIKSFQQHLKTNPGHTESVYHLGMAYFKNKQYEDARKSFEMVARVADPYEAMSKDSKRYLEKIDSKLMANAGLHPATAQKRPASLSGLNDGSDYYAVLYQEQGGKSNTFNLIRPVTVFVQSGKGVAGWTAEKEKYAVQTAMASWKSAMGNRLNFQMAPNAESADIIVRWTTSDPEVAGLCMGYGWGGKQLQAYVDLYTFHPDGVTPYSNQDLAFAATHEFGHALGMGGHSPYEEDVMYYTFSPKQTGRLTSRDVKTMQMIYNQEKQTSYSQEHLY